MMFRLACKKLISGTIGLVVRLLVKISDMTAPSQLEPSFTKNKRAEVDAAIDEAVQQGGYRTHVTEPDLLN